MESTRQDAQAAVMSFIASMNAWELAIEAERREAKRRGKVYERSEAMQTQILGIFNEHCAPSTTDLRSVRYRSYQTPPEYDPKTERIILRSDVSPDTVHIVTERECVMGGRFRYTVRHTEGKWLIEGIEAWDRGRWLAEIL
jgi:hypothetical protein